MSERLNNLRAIVAETGAQLRRPFTAVREYLLTPTPYKTWLKKEGGIPLSEQIVGFTEDARDNLLGPLDLARNMRERHGNKAAGLVGTGVALEVAALSVLTGDVKTGAVLGVLGWMLVSGFVRVNQAESNNFPLAFK